MKKKEIIYRITKRNKDVLRLLWMPTNNDIAKALFISPTTVATHLVRIRQILGSRTKAETLILALIRRFITLEEIAQTMREESNGQR